MPDSEDVQQIVDDARQLLNLSLHHFARFHQDGIPQVALLHDVQSVANRSKRVAQFVGQDGKELVLAARRFGQIIRPLSQILFQTFPLRDIASNLGSTDDVPLGVPYRRNGKRYVEQRAIFTPADCLKMVDALAALEPAQYLGLFRQPLVYCSTTG